MSIEVKPKDGFHFNAGGTGKVVLKNTSATGRVAVKLLWSSTVRPPPSAQQKTAGKGGVAAGQLKMKSNQKKVFPVRGSQDPPSRRTTTDLKRN